MKKKTDRLALTVWLAVFLAGGCGTLVGNPEDDEDGKSVPEESPIAENQAASLTFNIADAPIDEVQSVFVTITGVEIKPEAGDWISIPLVVQQEIDLLQYQDGASLKFAETGPIAAGVYSETRLLLSESVSPRIVLLDGSTHDLKVPGGEESGLKLKTPFTAEAGKDVDLTLDFDLRRSLKISGQGDKRKYTLQPVLRLLKHGEYGHIEGDETAGRIVCVYPEGVQPDTSDSCENALNSAIVKNGKYKLPHLPKGKYKIQVYDKDGKPIDGKQSDADVTPAKYKKLKGDEDGDGADQGDDDDDKKEEKGKDKENKAGQKDEEDND